MNRTGCEKGWESEIGGREGMSRALGAQLWRREGEGRLKGWRKGCHLSRTDESAHTQSNHVATCLDNLNGAAMRHSRSHVSVDLEQFVANL